MPLVSVVLGPVPSGAARAWIASASASMEVIRRRPDLLVPPAIVSEFQRYLDEWTDLLAEPEFRWAGAVNAEFLRSLAAHWARLATLAREKPESGLGAGDPAGEPFFDALAVAMADALARSDDAEQFAPKFEEVVPEFAPAPAPPAPEPPATLRRVLLVDDNADIRLLLRIGLETSGGFRIVGEAGNGQEAVDALEAGCPDAILLDISMPVMDGLTALPLLKQRCAEAKVVVFSADDSAAVRHEVSACGGSWFLRKDTAITDIAEVLRTA